MRRRRLLSASALLSLGGFAPCSVAVSDPAASPEALLRAGGLVVAMRHAQAPGTYDPPGFRVGDCSTQRNLDDEGRAQARRIGAWYRERGLAPTAVRASAWCRCVDTAGLAFGRAVPWPPLDSLARDRGAEAAQVAAMRAELARRAEAKTRGFEVWVTHQFNLTALMGGAVRPGEALLLRHDAASGSPLLLASLALE